MRALHDRSCFFLDLLSISRLIIPLIGCSALLGFSFNVRTRAETAETLLSKYGWTIKEKLAKHELALPASFEHQPGDFPLAIYWAYNNEFSKEVGLDLKPYLGSSVTALIYSLNEPLPAFLPSWASARGVVITREDAVIGAWIDRGRHHAFACSLNRKSFDEIVKRSWGDWLVSSGVVNPENELDKKLARMTPEEVIAFYYNAIDRQDYRSAYASMSREMAINYLFGNMGKSELFNRAYSESSRHGGIENIASSKLKRIKLWWNKECYEVLVDMKFKRRPPTLAGDGTYGWFIYVTNEIDGLGWRISSIGTGP